MGHRIQVEVNGKSYEKEVDPRRLLVHFLREDLGLTGTNVGCETSLCGACRSQTTSSPFPEGRSRSDRHQRGL